MPAGADGAVGATGAAGGAIVQLYENVAGGNIASWDVTGISQSYNHLQIVFAGRTDAATTNQLLRVRFNNDSGANYDSQEFAAAATAAAGEEFIADTGGVPGETTGTSATANYVGNTDMTIADYKSTTFYKTFVATDLIQWGTASVNCTIIEWGGTWRDTSAINRITVLPYTSGNFIAGSRLSIYGLL